MGPRGISSATGATSRRSSWPDGSKVVVNLVVNYEEGAEYSLLDGDAFNDAWGEYAYTIPPTVRDIGDRDATWSSAVASASGGSRGCIEDYGIDALDRRLRPRARAQPRVLHGSASGTHDVIGHGYRWTEDSRMTREEERRYLDLAIESIERTTGQRIRGWIVRSMPSVNTRELLSRKAASSTTRTPPTTSSPTS